MSDPFSPSRGFTYVELLMALAIGVLLVAGLSGVVGQALQTRDVAHTTNNLKAQNEPPCLVPSKNTEFVDEAPV